MSYRNPQYIKDKSVDVIIKHTDAAKARMDQIDDQRSAMFKENVSSVVQGAVNAMTQQKKGLENLNKSVTRNQINMYKRVGGKDFDTGFSDYDQQAETLFYDAITQYNEIKAHLDNNTLIDSEAGKKDLAKIENMIDVYGQSVPNIIAVAKAIEEQARPGADGFSATGAPAWQLNMIREIVNNEGKVQIKQENGNLYLYDPELEYEEEDENGKTVKKKGGILDLVQFNKMLLDEDNPYLKYKVNPEPVEEAAYKTFMYKDDKLKDDVSSDGKMTKEQQQNYMNGVTGLGSFVKDKKTDHYKGYPPSQFETILQEAGDSYWADIMKKNEPWNYGKYQEGTKEYDDFIENQYIPALNQLAQESLENNNDGIDPEDGKWFWDESSDESDTADEEVVEETNDEEIVEDSTDDEESDTETIVEYYKANKMNKPTYEWDDKTVDFEKDSELFLSEQEVKHGGNDNSGKATSLKEYAPGGERYDSISEHLNSKDLVGKKEYFDGTDKRGLKTDLGEDVYNGLSDPQKAILRMEHLNVGWNPKVLMLVTAGLIKPEDRGKYHKPQNQKDPSKWDVNKLYEANKNKLPGLLKGKDAQMLAGLDDIYKKTDNSKSNLSADENAKRKLGFEEQYNNRIRDIKAHYKIPDVVEEEKEVANKVKKENKSNVL